ncbi:single-stranded DNA-binding protein [uncultured Dubosiella sp.]|uniref:single-stranded DNA-binding protein n=1 Tax=uncultured Dubosiella sp. TaxID=1937011 RepID=UPI0020867E87|nr:single-stranded DNA-binding protein [uncultured Dubosiella sp.]GJM57091.1 single-stranded DNA-binding protein [Erysipelotrichaceae bacterium OPF54]
MINRVVLIGRLTKDPELRKTQSGTSVVSYTIAVNRRSQTPGQPDADFINCVAWNKTAELMAQYLHKGSLIGVEGRIQTRSYDNQQGQRVYVTEVVTDSVQFLEPKNAQPQQNSYNSYNSYSQPAPVNPYAAPADNSFSSAFDADDTLDIASDDLPF